MQQLNYLVSGSAGVPSLTDARIVFRHNVFAFAGHPAATKITLLLYRIIKLHKITIMTRDI